MKTIKSILIAATLICASAVSTLSAQQADAPAYQWRVAKGDSVMIKPECQQYLTGEKPSYWVYDSVHTVYQLGTKRFPEGVMLMHIASWICEDCLMPVTPREPQAADGQRTQAPAAAPQTPSQPAHVPAQAPAAAPAPAPAPAQAEQVPVETDPAQAPVPVPVPAAAPAPAPAPAQAEQAPTEAEPAPAPAPAEAAPAEVAPVEAAPAEQAPVEAAPVEEEPVAIVAQGDTMTLTQSRNGYDRFTIGVRGGAAGLLHTVVSGNWTCGGDVLLDLQYAHYWTKEGRPVDLGIIVGLGLGYSQSGMKAAIDTSYTVSTTDGNIDYTLKADEVKENDGQLQMEIPVMFSLIHNNGLFFNFGPKFMLPLYTPYNQQITNPLINAYFPAEGVNVSNEVITGYLTDNQMHTSGTDNGNQFAINVMLTAEIGYEWTLKSGNSLGLGAYANYSVYNTFKNNASAKSLMDVTAPQGSTVASVDVLSATKTYATGLGYFDAGVKVAYHFNFPKKQYKQFSESKLF
jgi:hypothetical protein